MNMIEKKIAAAAVETEGTATEADATEIETATAMAIVIATEIEIGMIGIAVAGETSHRLLHQGKTRKRRSESVRSVKRRLREALETLKMTEVLGKRF